jgi:hypothetical protein
MDTARVFMQPLGKFELPREKKSLKTRGTLTFPACYRRSFLVWRPFGCTFTNLSNLRTIVRGLSAQSFFNAINPLLCCIIHWFSEWFQNEELKLTSLQCTSACYQDFVQNYLKTKVIDFHFLFTHREHSPWITDASEGGGSMSGVQLQRVGTTSPCTLLGFKAYWGHMWLDLPI